MAEEEDRVVENEGKEEKYEKEEAEAEGKT